jgi:hypothetical protein
MSRRQTDEERIVNFFTNATPEQATTLLNVITGIMHTKKPQPGKGGKAGKTGTATPPQPIAKAGD